VSPSQLDALVRYVETQEEHHRSRTFQEEYRDFLRKLGVECDERYHPLGGECQEGKELVFPDL
jgi:hypothetical protein